MPHAAADPRADSPPEAWRVEVFKRDAFDDPDGTHALAALREAGATGLEGARLGRGYLLPPDLGREAVERVARELLADPVLDAARIYAPGERPPPAPGGTRRLLVARRAGVMDPIAQTIERALVRSGLAGAVPLEGRVATFAAWELVGAEDPERLAAAAGRALANEVVDELVVGAEALPYGQPSPGPRRGVISVPLREADDAALLRTSAEGALSLSLLEMRAIRDHYRALEREPTACELETLAQTWSEHCQHKTFRGRIEMDGEVIDNLLKSTIVAATEELARPWCVSVFHDNAGIVEFDGGYDLAFKVETHNHPSAIDPYGGAGTGIGGVIRDILGVGLGAKPIANTDAFFVGPPDLPAEHVPKGSMHPRRILRGVVAGVRDYGNRMGIPTVGGGVWFDEGYVANPLVYAGTLGLLPHSAATKSVRPGDAIVVVGGRTGRDGIHGATFSSAELSEASEVVSASAVQIGDPITEKRVLDGLLVARDRGLYRGVTDCGAGGLSSAVGEMGAECGAEVDLERVPLKYPGLAPEEIWISEAQERMVLAVPPERLDACLAAFADEDCEATAIGRFTDSGRLVLRYDGETVGELDLEFLHEGTPRPTRRATWSPPDLPDPGVARCEDPAGTLLRLLARPGIASKEWIVRQYDHEVQGASVVKPLVGARCDAPSDAAVLQPLPTSRKGVALGAGANPRYGRLDPGAMAEAVIDEALRNAVAVGGDPDRTAILDNFSWGNCEKPDRLGALVHAARGCRRAAVAYGTPFISGKDSLNNEYQVGGETLSIPPTLYVSALSIVPDVARATTMDAKKEGNLLLLVGETRAEFGGSEYFADLRCDGGRVPRPDLERAPVVLRKLHAALRMGFAVSCHDLSEGGLGVALAEMCFAGGLGAEVDLAAIDHHPFPQDHDRDTTLLFAESCTRFLVEVEPGRKFNFQTKLMGLPATPIGRFLRSGTLRVKGSDGRPWFELPVEDARAAFRGAFQG